MRVEVEDGMVVKGWDWAALERDLARVVRAGWQPQAVADAQAVEAVAVEHVASYLQLKAEIAELEREASEHRAAIVETLGTGTAAPGKVWAFPGVGSVTVVKGRVSERLDRAVLAKAGVAGELLDKATTRTEGAPSLRITKDDEAGGAE